MEKKGHLVPNWKRRYFSFDPSKGALAYYADDDKRNFKSSYIVAADSNIEVVEAGLDKHKFVLKLVARTNGKESVLFMAPNTIEERERWFEIFAELIWGVKVNQPKLCGLFRNQVPLKIKYGMTEVNDGCVLLPEITENTPIIEYYVPPQSSSYHCLIMVNPDPPSFVDRDDRRKSVFGMTNLRNYAHWVVCNIPGDDISAGTSVVDYLPSCPVYNTDYQRHFFLLFDQGTVFMSPDEIVEAEAYFQKRGGVQVCQWAEEQGFGLPIGVNGFQAKWAPFSDEVHKLIGFMPPPEHRSPGQIGWLERLSMEKRLKETELKAGERAKLEEIERQREAAENDDITKLFQPDADVERLMTGFKVRSREVFEGVWVKKKFTNNYTTSRRFVWIDVFNQKFWWKKNEGKDDGKDAKYIDIKQDAYKIKITDDNSGFEMTMNDGRGLKVTFNDGNKLQLSEDFVTVIMQMIPNDV